MNEFKFHYCIGNNKNKFDKYLKISKNKSKLCINKYTHIYIKFCENNDEKFIEINFDDVQNFIDFVHDKNLNCGGDFDHFDCDHNCRHSKYYSEYLDHIFKNNILHHIESPQLKNTSLF
nr:ankyrin repeat domain containing protein [Mimivirus sp.]